MLGLSFQAMGWHRLLHTPPADNARNIMEYSMYVGTYKVRLSDPRQPAAAGSGHGMQGRASYMHVRRPTSGLIAWCSCGT
jgi:hypothetical protein